MDFSMKVAKALNGHCYYWLNSFGINNPNNTKPHQITPTITSPICLPLNEVCSRAMKSVAFRFAKFSALNGGIKNTTLRNDITQKGFGK